MQLKRGLKVVVSHILRSVGIHIRQKHASKNTTSTSTNHETIANFDDLQLIYKSKSLLDLIRAYGVLKLCSFSFLVRHQEQLLKLSRRILGDYIFAKLLRSTIFKHFAGGETLQEVSYLAKKLASNGVGTILDYSVEEDLQKDSAELLDDNSHFNALSPPYRPDRMYVDRRCPRVLARCFFYQNEARCEENMQAVLNSIDRIKALAECGSGNAYAALKLTALGKPHVLLQLSQVVQSSRTFFKKTTGIEPVALSDITPENLGEKLHITRNRKEFDEWLSQMDFDNKGIMNLFSWSGLIGGSVEITRLFQVPDVKTGKMEPLATVLREDDEVAFRNMMRRLHTIAKVAKEKRVSVMVDAEQSYFQLAISRLTLELMRVYNKEHPVIFNTYQCYLKNARRDVRVSLELARRQGFHLAVKLVRGAYMDHERLRAKEQGYEDPINPSYDATTAMYHGALTDLLQDSGRVSVLVATHSEESIKYALRLMEELRIEKRDGKVNFGQLLGMADYLSFPLGAVGYSVYKYVPYGPVLEVLPYLSRRLVENNSVIDKLSKEVRMVRREIFRRLSVKK
ncbi:proline dehydrogenase 1, mitochondrial-like [Ornithodoros turicata]|uniref:proline dehydrogenase 1, mitochondrial-like n=1 Tax=Ornithodoros turicata TaxID=34597 RepID=UPI00313974D3